MKSKIMRSKEELLEEKKTILRLESFILATAITGLGFMGLNDYIRKEKKQVNNKIDNTSIESNNSNKIIYAKDTISFTINGNTYYFVPVGYTLTHDNIAVKTTNKPVYNYLTDYINITDESTNNINSLTSIAEDDNNLNNVFAPKLVRTK